MAIPVLAADEAEADKVVSAVVEAKADITRDTEALNALRAEIAAQRRPLAARLEQLQERVVERRAEARRIRRLQVQGEKEQAGLEAEAAGVEEECRFILSLFSEYARAMETRVGAAEGARLSKQLRPVQTALTENESFDGFADGVARLLALSAASNGERLGGNTFDGAALDANGIENEGRFAAFGPIAYFTAQQDGPAGLAVTQFGAAQPGVYDRFAETVPPAIREIAAGGSAVVPLDVTSGDAIKVQEAKATLPEHLKKGGFVMVPLLVVAVAAILLALWKTIELAGVKVQPGEQIDAIVQAVRDGDIAKARALAGQIRPPLRSLVEEAIEHHDSPRDHLEEIMHEHVLTSLPWLERNLGALAVLGGIAPLLGLLGTVTGMIHTFQLVTIFGSGDAKLLSGGISEALVTTETGLAIAIPVLLVHAFLARRARSIVGALECMAVSIVNDLKARN